MKAVESAPAPAAYYDLDEVSADARMIIRTGNLSLVVADTTKSVEAIRSIVEGLDGYIVNSNAYRVGEYIRANLTVRVPAESFDAAMAQIKGVATVVNQDNVSGDDVTEEYSDLQAQLRNLEATEEELRQLLTEVRERTGKAEDIMAVYRELTNIRGQIEQIKGRTQYLERMTAMATIHIDLEPDIAETPIPQEGWRPNATASSAINRLVNAFRFLGDAIIWLVLYVLPIALVILAPLALLLFLIARWRRKSKARAQKAE